MTAFIAYEYERNNMMFFLQSKSAITAALECAETQTIKERVEFERDAASKVSRELRGKNVHTYVHVHSYINVYV
jgi:hypothetical protein